MKPLIIVVTSGDVDGIGSEISCKALSKLKFNRKIRWILWRSPKCPKSHLRKVDSQHKRITVSNWPDALKLVQEDSKDLIDICSDISPAQWVEISAKAAHFGHIDAIVTAPLSKTTIQSAGLKDIGHTDILKRVSGSEDVFMGFYGKQMSIVLATGHIPISKVPKDLSVNKLIKACRAANALGQALGNKKEIKPIGLVALNPHAGEKNLIGNEEEDIYSLAIKKLRKESISVSEPLVPDVVFSETQRKKYSVFVSPYHDQGLIPFKMLHHKSHGVHISLGLPFIRTSVDHGTAKDIFNKNKADYESMLEAMKLAVKIVSDKDIKKKFLEIN